MDGDQQSNPRTVEEVFRDFKGRRAGIIKALTINVEEFHRQCDPEKENLCLYGFPTEQWEVNLPAEEVPPELPEPALGINFARDGMQDKDWLSLVAVHSDAWLLAVAFYFGARFGFDKADRKRLFNMINDLPTIYEVVTGMAKKQAKEKSSASNHSGNKSKSNSKAINFLLTNTTIEINAPNACGLTAMDILAYSRRHVKDMDILEFLQQVGALKSRDTQSVRAKSSSVSHSNHLKPISLLGSQETSGWEKHFRKQDAWLDKQRDALMVVASLIATMAFQAGINPPGGVWGDTRKANSQVGSSSSRNDDTPPHMAGTSMMADTIPVVFDIFLACYTTSFIASLSIILLLTSSLPFKRRVFMWILIVIMWLAVYANAFSIIAITPLHERVLVWVLGRIVMITGFA
ncbi:uncharacterized protein LOC132308078 isoform X1 [Cornus florida]|uniref:uncharacterized protein LOC132308078 isoform X1 n=1 Tax=Cornus florida TaxID=4283 RepID=UPI002898AFB8|nr:uncharacterized protein LOC132308078 isoform X1 [Cornus florida]XP_059662033.1 uncharacterized protein LOC132308078 isoform X1 [Cornus florida]